MGSEKKNIYTAEDIHRYFSGKMTSSQMHAMEKAALNDPLLAEAMDGYNSLASFTDEKKFSKLQRELNGLKNKLSVKNTEERRYNNLRWKAAAAILLLFGTVFALYIIKHSNNNQEAVVAKKENSTNAPVMKPAADSTIVAIKKDSAAAVESLTTSASTNKEIVSADILKHTTNPKENAGKKIAAPQSFAATQMDKRPDNIQELRLSKTANNSGHIFSGKITDANNNAIAYADIIINNTKQSKTDANGMFNLTLPDSVIRLDVMAGNYYPKTTNITANNFTTITLITKKNPLKKNLTDTFTRSEVQVLYKRSVEPRMGWEKYQLYLVNELSNSEYDDGRRVTGVTIMDFEINRMGKPENFTFEKSIDNDVNDALEDLIINGPEWKFLENGGIPGSVRLRIVF